MDPNALKQPNPYLSLEIPLLFFVWMSSACAAVSERGDAGPQSRHGTEEAGGSAKACIPCVTSSDCSAGTECAQFAGDTYCAATCAVGHPCSIDHACSSAPSASGALVEVCVPRGDVCSSLPDARTDGGSTGSIAASGEVTGSVGAGGGHVSRLYFVVVGDTRPASVDDTSGYPLPIVHKIFQDLQSLDPVPLFGVSTGDYMFASTLGGQAARQLDLYLYARASFSGIMFPAMGNHECTGATTSNCGVGNADGTPTTTPSF